MKISRRERIMVIALLVVLVIAGYYFLFFEKWMADMDTLDKDILVSTIALQTDAMKKTNFEVLQEELAALEKEYEELTIGCYTGNPEGLRDLHRIFTDNTYPNSNSIAFEPHEIVPYGYLNIVKADLEVWTTYDRYTSMLSDFKESAMLNRILEAEILWSPDNKDCSAKFTVEYLSE